MIGGAETGGTGIFSSGYEDQYPSEPETTTSQRLGITDAEGRRIPVGALLPVDTESSSE